MISSSSSLHLHVRERSSSPCTWRICFDSLSLFVLSNYGLFSCRQAVGAKWLGGQQVHQWHTCTTAHDTKFLECNLQEVHMTQDHVFVQGLSIQQGSKESRVNHNPCVLPSKETMTRGNDDRAQKGSINSLNPRNINTVDGNISKWNIFAYVFVHSYLY